MNTVYVNKIKSNLKITTKRKTTNVIDGAYRSIYKGKSLNFDNLREYVLGDNIKDVDWKASARSHNLLIKQYVAFKKHNVLLLMDNGKNMLANANLKDLKKDLALLAGGTIGYLAVNNGDYVATLNNSKYISFKTGIPHLESILMNYDKSKFNDAYDLNQVLEFVLKHIKKRMVIVIITDLAGLDNVNEMLLKKVIVLNDILFINIDDVSMLSNLAFDIEDNNYVPPFLIKDEYLCQIERNLKEQVSESVMSKLKKYGSSYVTIKNHDEVVIKIVDLLRRKHG